MKRSGMRAGWGDTKEPLRVHPTPTVSLATLAQRSTLPLQGRVMEYAATPAQISPERTVDVTAPVP